MTLNVERLRSPRVEQVMEFQCLLLNLRNLGVDQRNPIPNLEQWMYLNPRNLGK